MGESYASGLGAADPRAANGSDVVAFASQAPRVIPATVLDPFAGAGTTLLVADRLQRNAVGIELNAAYTTMAMERCRADAPLFSSWPPAEDPADQRMAYDAGSGICSRRQRIDRRATT